MLFDAVALLSIRCNQCALSMNDSNAWHDTYLTVNAHGKCRSVFLDEISCLLGKCNWLELFYFLESRNKIPDFAKWKYANDLQNRNP